MRFLDFEEKYSDSVVFFSTVLYYDFLSTGAGQGVKSLWSMFKEYESTIYLL